MKTSHTCLPKIVKLAANSFFLDNVGTLDDEFVK